MNRFEESLKALEMLDENGAISLKGGYTVLSLNKADDSTTTISRNVNVDVSGWGCACRC
ncbi:hypothetical protein [Bacteroides acidifaciens]|jgi:hypothetical protein|uniref:hypothetical protein n=1 Tax=Bacteroides acidifaciens TaxID=85831 RepID=UPI0025941390|nr:hypothetical protein [Bacteroides acidifaciens]